MDEWYCHYVGIISDFVLIACELENSFWLIWEGSYSLLLVALGWPIMNDWRQDKVLWFCRSFPGYDMVLFLRTVCNSNNCRWNCGHHGNIIEEKHRLMVNLTRKRANAWLCAPAIHQLGICNLGRSVVPVWVGPSQPVLFVTFFAGWRSFNSHVISSPQHASQSIKCLTTGDLFYNEEFNNYIQTVVWSGYLLLPPSHRLSVV